MISNLEYYRTFLYVANLRSFTKAAELLYISQSAVSQTIKKLENELNCNLFERTSHGLVLTEEGEELYLHVQKAMEELDRGENALSNMSSLRTGELQIGATETSVRHFISPKIKEFKANNPNIRITFKGGNTSDLCIMLQNGEIEIAFLISPIPHSYQFHLTKILDFQDIPVVSTEFAMDLSKIYDISELINYPLITVDPTNQVRRIFDEWFMKEDVFLNPDYTVRSMGLVLPLVQNNLGIGFIPGEYVQSDIEKGRLAQVLTKSLPEKRTLYLAIRSAGSVSTIGKRFLSEFVCAT